MAASKKAEQEMKTPKEKAKAANESPASESNENQQLGRDNTRSLVKVLAVVGLVVSLVYIYPYLANMFGKQKEVFTSVDQIGQRHILLEEKVATLEQRLAEIQDKLIKEVANKDSLQLLSKRLDVLENQLKGVEHTAVRSEGGTRKQDEHLASTLKNLKVRVEGLEQIHAEEQNQLTRIPQVILTFSELRDAILGHKPFVEELNKVIQLVDQNDPAIKDKLVKLKAIAASGVPTYEQLEREFSVLMHDFRHHAIPEDLPWYQKIVHRLRSLVVVKREGEPVAGGSDVDYILSDIHNELIQADLETALNLADKLPGKESQQYTVWRDRAENRVFIDDMYPILETSALTQLMKTKVKEVAPEAAQKQTNQEEKAE